MSIENIFQSIVQLKRDEIADLVQAEIDASTDISVILEEGLINAMGTVGDEFSEGRLFVPEMLSKRDIQRVPTHDTPEFFAARRGRKGALDPGEEERLEQLRQLGYIVDD